MIFSTHTHPQRFSHRQLSNHRRGKWLATLSLVVWMLCAPLMALAQTPADIESAQRQAEIIQRQEQDRLQREQDDARQRASQVDGMDTKGLQPKIKVPTLGATCREISRINVTGVTQLPGWALTKITQPFVNRCLDVGDIERLLGELTAHYIDAGFITTRAYLPPQDLSLGVLEITVLEGVVEKISLEDGATRSVLLANTFPGAEGGLLNLRDLEQGIDQINRLSSNNAQLDIQPGVAPGGSHVVVRNTPSFPLHVSVSTDNQGSESTGAQQTGVTVTTDNVLGLNDMLSATRRESIPNEPGRMHSASDSVSFSVPFGHATVSLGSSYSVYDSTIHVPSGLALLASGNSKSDNLRLDRVIYRNQSTRAALSTTLTNKQSKNYLDGQFLAVSSRTLTVLDVDGNLSMPVAGGALTLELGYAVGLDKAGALKDPDNLPDWAARAQFSKLKVGFSYNRPMSLFGQSISFSSQFTGQQANDTLYGSEQISIGGLYSVRGFVKNSLSGDDGYHWRNELSVREPLSFGDQTISTRFYVGYDTGEVKNRTANIPEGRLAGMVIGLSANWRGATWDFFNTRPLSLPDHMTRESSQTWFRFSYSF